MDLYSETCVKHDRALRFIIQDHFILNSVLLQDCSVLGVLKSKTFRKPRVELPKILAEKHLLCSCFQKYMHFSLAISENLIYMIRKKKKPSHINLHSRSMSILFAVRDFNFHLIISSLCAKESNQKKKTKTRNWTLNCIEYSWLNNLSS